MKEVTVIVKRKEKKSGRLEVSTFWYSWVCKIACTQENQFVLVLVLMKKDVLILITQTLPLYSLHCTGTLSLESSNSKSVFACKKFWNGLVGTAKLPAFIVSLIELSYCHSNIIRCTKVTC